MEIAIIIAGINLIAAMALREWCDRKATGYIDKWKRK